MRGETAQAVLDRQARAGGELLAGTLRSSQLLSIGIGAIMGVGWAIVLGAWLTAAGPLGTVIGFAIGGACLALVAACYAELATTMPLAGGEVVYLGALFGPAASFMVGWFLVLMSVAITGFEAISLAWFLDRLFPGHQGPLLYSLLGSEIHAGALAIGFAGCLLVALANYRGAQMSGRLQELFTYVKAAAILLFVGAAFLGGTAHPLSPLWPAGARTSSWLGVGWIAATTPLWLAGFQVVPQGIEERDPSTPLARVGRLTVLSVLLGIAFYAAVVLACTRAVAWPQLIRAPLPAVTAVESAMGSPVLARAVLLAVILGILATWNSAFLWATRLLLALGREQLIPGMFARIGHFRTPTCAIVLVAALGLVSVLLGRGALLPIVGMASMSLTISYAFTCAAALKQRRLSPQLARPYRVPGGTFTMRIALIASALMGAYGLIDPWLHSRGVPIEWVLLAVWLAAGILLLRQSRAARSSR